MPAILSHWLLGKQVFPQVIKSDPRLSALSESSFLWGCQGPDILFFQRMYPWQHGQVLRQYGGLMHSDKPSKLFSSLTGLLGVCDRKLYNDILSYSLGVCCHYCFDCAAHPYIVWLEDKMTRTDPRGSDYHYHGTIESALDVILLRRKTGQLTLDVNLRDCIPDNRLTTAAIAVTYTHLLGELYGVKVEPRIAALLTSDMRACFALLNDSHAIRRPILGFAERLFGKGSAPVTAYMRTVTETLDYDFANVSHARWHNIYDETQQGNEDYFELFDRAEKGSYAMIAFFMDALDARSDFAQYTGERSFSNNVDESALPSD